MIAFCATAAAAQSPLGVNLGVGPTFPIGDDKGVGMHLNAGLAFGVPALPVGLRVEGMAQRIPEGDDHHQYFGASLNAEVGLPVPLARPYAIGGVGFVWHREHHGDHAHDAHTDFAINVGLGTQFGLLGRSAYVEARYHRLTGGGHGHHDDHDHGHGHGHGHGDGHSGNVFIPVTFGIRF